MFIFLDYDEVVVPNNYTQRTGLCDGWVLTNCLPGTAAE